VQKLPDMGDRPLHLKAKSRQQKPVFAFLALAIMTCLYGSYYDDEVFHVEHFAHSAHFPQF
jgi:hypothetical protein